MTERSEPKRILKVAELTAQLSEETHLRLTNAVGAGLFNARMAAQCLTDPDRQHENVLQLLTYLTTAISELQAARSIVQEQS